MSSRVFTYKNPSCGPSRPLLRSWPFVPSTHGTLMREEIALTNHAQQNPTAPCKLLTPTPEIMGSVAMHRFMSIGGEIKLNAPSYDPEGYTSIEFDKDWYSDLVGGPRFMHGFLFNPLPKPLSEEMLLTTDIKEIYYLMIALQIWLVAKGRWMSSNKQSFEIYQPQYIFKLYTSDFHYDRKTFQEKYSQNMVETDDRSFQTVAAELTFAEFVVYLEMALKRQILYKFTAEKCKSQYRQFLNRRRFMPLKTVNLSDISPTEKNSRNEIITSCKSVFIITSTHEEIPIYYHHPFFSPLEAVFSFGPHPDSMMTKDMLHLFYWTMAYYLSASAIMRLEGAIQETPHFKEIIGNIDLANETQLNQRKVRYFSSPYQPSSLLIRTGFKLLYMCFLYKSEFYHVQIDDELLKRLGGSIYLPRHYNFEECWAYWRDQGLVNDNGTDYIVVNDEDSENDQTINVMSEIKTPISISFSQFCVENPTSPIEMVFYDLLGGAKHLNHSTMETRWRVLDQNWESSVEARKSEWINLANNLKEFLGCDLHEFLEDLVVTNQSDPLIVENSVIMKFLSAPLAVMKLFQELGFDFAEDHKEDVLLSIPQIFIALTQHWTSAQLWAQCTSVPSRLLNEQYRNKISVQCKENLSLPIATMMNPEENDYLWSLWKLIEKFIHMEILIPYYDHVLINRGPSTSNLYSIGSFQLPKIITFENKESPQVLNRKRKMIQSTKKGTDGSFFVRDITMAMVPHIRKPHCLNFAINYRPSPDDSPVFIACNIVALQALKYFLERDARHHLKVDRRIYEARDNLQHHLSQMSSMLMVRNLDTTTSSSSTSFKRNEMTEIDQQILDMASKRILSNRGLDESIITRCFEKYTEVSTMLVSEIEWKLAVMVYLLSQNPQLKIYVDVFLNQYIFPNLETRLGFVIRIPRSMPLLESILLEYCKMMNYKTDVQYIEIDKHPGMKYPGKLPADEESQCEESRSSSQEEEEEEEEGEIQQIQKSIRNDSSQEKDNNYHFRVNSPFKSFSPIFYHDRTPEPLQNPHFSCFTPPPPTTSSGNNLRNESQSFTYLESSLQSSHPIITSSSEINLAPMLHMPENH